VAADLRRRCRVGLRALLTGGLAIPGVRGVTAARTPQQAGPGARAGSLAPLGLQPGPFALHGLARITQAGQGAGDHGRIGRARAARLALDEDPRPREESAALVRTEPGPRRNRQLVEVIADELLGGGLHVAIIPLLGQVVESAYAA
jgi:hypothetical protein